MNILKSVHKLINVSVRGADVLGNRIMYSYVYRIEDSFTFTKVRYVQSKRGRPLGYTYV